MSISGKNVLNTDGTPFVFRGYNQGHGELTMDHDPIQDVQDGANTVRIIWRVWGDYGGENGIIVDGQDINGPGRLNFDYLEGIVDRVRKAKAAGLKVDLAGDSNCGQSGKQDADMILYCTIGSTPGCNFYMPDGQQQLGYFLEAWRWLARRLLGLVDFYEPLVEPSAEEGNVAATWAIQSKIRQIIMQEDPAALFIMGPWPAYQVPSIGDAYNPAWAADNNTILTANLLDSAVVNSETIATKVGQFVSARNTFNVPVMVNQIGSNSSSDPTDSYLNTALGLLDSAAGGSVGYTIWEKVSVNLGSYGTFIQDTIGGPRTEKPNRRAVISTHFNAAKIAAT
jgi:hypothetical protein